MTRETKIGLLVGLAFIIVIGILLSDHLNGVNEPAPAQVSNAGGNVRAGVTSPSGGGDASTTGGPASAPRAPVPGTPDLRQPHTPPVGVVAIGPGSSGAPIDIRQRDPSGRVGIAPPQGEPIGTVAIGPGGTEPLGPVAEVDISHLSPEVQELLRRHPQELAIMGSRAGTSATSGATNVGPAPGAPVRPPRQYTAEPGDSVSRMAARLLGADNKTNRELIIRANPSMQAEGNPVYVGRTYVIPNVGTPLPVSPAAPATPVARAPEPAPVPAAPANTVNVHEGQPFRWYTVKDNDNLWKIAASQCGSGNEWTALKDLNRDILRGGETVRANMRIRIPAKNVADVR